MKNVLAIEIKDNKTIVTLTKIKNGDYSLLLHKTFGSKPLAKHIYYDAEIITRIKEELRIINFVNDIDEKYITINTKKVSISSRIFEHNYNHSFKETKENFINQLKRENPKLHIGHVIFSRDGEGALTKQNISATIEATQKEYINEILNLYKKEGITFNKVIPVVQTIENSVKEYVGDAHSEDVCVSVFVEEKFAQYTAISKGKIIYSMKIDFGLTNIYSSISDKMSIKKNEAKKLFKSFGSIPPEDVVDDKVIHTIKNGKELTVFTKKDLSRYITEMVMELFANVKYYIDKLKSANKSIKLVFNGEIQKLVGFKKFATSSFAEQNILEYNSKLIGLIPETEFITRGMLLESKGFGLGEERRIDHQYKPKTNFFTKVFRMYNYI